MLSGRSFDRNAGVEAGGFVLDRARIRGRDALRGIDPLSYDRVRNA
jgi:hypothetical protein